MFLFRNMAEPDSEDSSDGTLVIDEPNRDDETIEITDESDIDIIDLVDNIQDTPSILNYPSSSSNSHLTCTVCFRLFSSNNELINHIRKFKGRLGGCDPKININITSTISGEKSKDRTPELEADHVYKKKKGNPPKTYSKLPVPESVPINPQLLPIILKPTSPNNNNHTKANCTDNNLPSVRQMLIEEADPVHPCTMCRQIFRHYIGLVCHMNSEHYNLSSDKVLNAKKSSTKSNEKKQNVRKSVITEHKSVITEHKSVITEHKSVENNEPVSNTVDLTLLPDSKKDSLLNRMKSYVHSHNKDLVVCVLCNMKFKSTKKALSHIEDKHIMNKIKCGYCNMKFVYELKLRSHMAKRHNIICVYKCDKCSKIMNKDECESHLEKCEGNPVNIKREVVEIL